MTSRRMDGELLEVWGILGTINVVTGHLDEALAAFEQAIQLAARRYGTSHPEYWRLASQNAALLHMALVQGGMADEGTLLGVSKRWWATASRTVLSRSWPMPVKTGTGHGARMTPTSMPH